METEYPNYESKTVLLTHWEHSLYDDYRVTGWEVRGYTEFNSAGIPKFAEIQRMTN